MANHYRVELGYDQKAKKLNGRGRENYFYLPACIVTVDAPGGAAGKFHAYTGFCVGDTVEFLLFNITQHQAETKTELTLKPQSAVVNQRRGSPFSECDLWANLEPKQTERKSLAFGDKTLPCNFFRFGNKLRYHLEIGCEGRFVLEYEMLKTDGVEDLLYYHDPEWIIGPGNLRCSPDDDSQRLTASP